MGPRARRLLTSNWGSSSTSAIAVRSRTETLDEKIVKAASEISATEGDWISPMGTFYFAESSPWGYSMTGKSLAETLLVRPGASLWFSPIEWLWILGPLPPGVTMTGEFAAATVAVVFVSNAASVRWFLNQHRTVMALPPVVWMCYPSHGRMDLNRGTLLTMVAGHSLQPVAEVAVDATWSAMRLRPIVKGRPSPIGAR